MTGSSIVVMSPASGSFRGLSISCTTRRSSSPGTARPAPSSQVHVELALEPLLHDFHVEQAEEPDGTEAQRDRRLRS